MGKLPLPSEALLTRARREFHASISDGLLTVHNGTPTNADGSNPTSVAIASWIAKRIGAAGLGERLPGQGSGSTFESIVASFLRETFPKLTGLRPGSWEILKLNARDKAGIARYEQYAHLAVLTAMAHENAELAAAMGRDYLIVPDTVIVRQPESDDNINYGDVGIVDEYSAKLTSLRSSNNPLPILHASISSKWTLRSDRAQNARTEALNLIRNRKGRLPHIVVVTGEPLPSRLASLALGTGDIDCVYHFALPELIEAMEEVNVDGSTRDLVAAMVDGKRLRDISDLSLDLAV